MINISTPNPCIVLVTVSPITAGPESSSFSVVNWAKVRDKLQFCGTVTDMCEISPHTCTFLFSNPTSSHASTMLSHCIVDGRWKLKIDMYHEQYRHNLSISTGNAETNAARLDYNGGPQSLIPISYAHHSNIIHVLLFIYFVIDIVRIWSNM